MHWNFSSSSSTCRSTFDTTSFTNGKEEDNILLALATNARDKVEHARCVFATAGWKGRKEGQGIRVFDRKSTPGVYDVAASTSLPCGVDEFLEVFSSRNCDDFNATMVALAGDAFSYAVTLREVPMASMNTHLTIKRMQFLGSIPLVSSAKTVEFLDYIDFNYKTRTAVRILQTLTCDQAGRLIVGGDVFAGYLLSEQVELHQTSVFYFGSHTMALDELKAKGIVKATFKAATACEATAHAVLKLANLVPKVCEIAIRRRLGAAYTVNSADNVVNERCSGCGKLMKESLLRKKYVCYLCCHHTCSSCSKPQDVEVLIGVSKRQRVCCMCIAAARHRAFNTEYQLEDGPMHHLRAASSTASSSRTDPTTPSRVLH
ncbi:unnamed protein product [Peronospora effusa]|uniref:FYVE-type domain-containing protein n=1 Tax=Peronospora effusa TaxID=542832 RepID=A0A3M6VKM9_9STRA|nr:hypothetical protein DD238_001423 [Peronospora effusa]RQM17732.1 hypothetical protein DD237_001203 [Peronospora effusa]CAI5702432.1 unnamed protein product [Peronospora effusa]